MNNIAICDDDREFIDYVKEIMKELDFTHSVNLYEYLSGEQFLFDLDNRYNLDLLILDIQMKETDGNQVAVEFRKRFKDTVLVFCSGVYKPSPENIKVAPYRFLLKEYSKEKMLKEFAEIFEHLKERSREPAILCCDEKYTLKVNISEIMYVSIARRGTEVHIYDKDSNFNHKKIYFCKQNLQELYEILKPYHFVYAHNSYIVNLRYICKRNHEEIQIANGEKLSVSRSRKKELEKEMDLYFCKKY